MVRVVVRCLLISLLLAIPAAAAFATGLVEINDIAASGSTVVALFAGGVILVSAFTSSLLASWWNGGEVVVTSAASGPDKGVVKWFNVAKGFGFITVDNGADIFVHFRDIRGKGHRSLTAGQRVAFEIKETDKGPQAHEVTIVADSS